MFAAFKIIGTILLACASVGAALVESSHPLLLACVCGAFLMGMVGAEAYRWYRSHNVRSSIPR